jgi:mycothione reductase
MKKYDVAVIGSGCGLLVMEAALARGLTCALVEKQDMGGTCLNRGCIPSKMLAYPADMIRQAQDAHMAGIVFAPPEIDFAKIAGRMKRQIRVSKEIEAALNATQNLTVYKGTGEFTRPGAMRVSLEGGYEEFEAGKFIIAAGARPFVPRIPGLEETGYLTTETFFGEKFPETPWDSLAVIGGGAVAAEFAHIFSAMGTRVSVVEKLERLLPAEEEEISEFVTAQFIQNGIAVHTGARILSIRAEGTQKVIETENARTGERGEVRSSQILLAAGIVSNADLLRPERVGIVTDTRGFIQTNGYLESSAENIYAIGDVNGRFPFRHKANYEAGVLSGNLFGGHKTEARYDHVPWAVFTHPQTAHVGLTEKEAKERGLRVYVGRNYYSEIAGGIAMGYSKKRPGNGFVKIVAGENRQILGVHIAGPSAAVLAQPFVHMMDTGFTCACAGRPADAENRHLTVKSVCPPLGTPFTFSQSMVIHPSLSELPAWAVDAIDWSIEA